MVAQQAATVTRSKTKPARKPAYRPRITFLSATEYLVPSERFAGQIIYKVTITSSGRAQCECKSSDYGKACKHRALALAAHAYRCNPSHQRPVTGEVAPSVAPGAGLGVRVASSGAGYEVYSLRTGSLICRVDDPSRAGLPTPSAQSVDARATLPAAFIPAPPAFSQLFAA